MIYTGLIHTMVGAVVKALVVRNSTLRWDPGVDGFTPERFAVDLALLFVFSFFSWQFTKFFDRLRGKFGNVFAPEIQSSSPIPPKGDKVKTSEIAWGTPLKNYSETAWYFGAFFASVLLTGIVALVDRLGVSSGPLNFGWVGLAVSGLAVLVAHEVVHYAAIPRAARKNSQFKCHLGIGGFVIVLNGVMRARQLLAIQVSPFVVLTLVPLALALFVPSAFANVLMFIAAFNSLLSGADLVSSVVVSRQVPFAAEVRLEGESGEWRPI